PALSDPLSFPTRRSSDLYASDLELPEWMRSREQFMQTVLAGRIATLREKIATHRPRAVVFYFWKSRQHVEAVAGGEFLPLIPERSEEHTSELQSLRHLVC